MADIAKIIIEPEAYIRMITHVLRFGNEALDESVEVMGLCIGKKDNTGNTFNLLNVIPLQHGIKVSTGFTKEDVELLANLNNEYQEKNVKIIGWYISRPGWGLDFTDITIQNHKFFQTEHNPQGFVIIFDHTIMGKDKDFGFKIYTLADFKKSTDYHEISYEIVLPTNLNYFKWVQKFVEDSQKLSPIIIKELREQPLGELQEIPLSTEDLVDKSIKDYSSQMEQVFTGFNNGLREVSESIGDTYKTQINNWVDDMTQGTLKGMEYVTRTTNQLKNTVSDGLRDVQNYLNNTFMEISSLFKKNVTEYIDKRIKGQQELKSEISNNLKENIEQIKNNFVDQLGNSINPIKEKITPILEIIDKNSRENSKMSEIAMDLNSLVSETDTNIKNLTNNIGEQIENILIPYKVQIEKKSEELDSELKPIQESHSEIKILLEKLQKIITDFRNLS
jgi:gas vesicle protein